MLKEVIGLEHKIVTRDKKKIRLEIFQHSDGSYSAYSQYGLKDDIVGGGEHEVKVEAIRLAIESLKEQYT